MLTLFYIIIFITTFRIYQSNEIRRALLEAMYKVPFDYDGHNLSSLKRRLYLEDFVKLHIINIPYNEDIKFYQASETDSENRHYIKDLNYLMGVRLTLNRVKLENNTDRGYQDAIETHRLANYQGRANSQPAEVDKTPFGRDEVQYQSDGGYKHGGGFVFFFNDTMDVSEAITYYEELVEDGLYDDNFLSLV